MAKANKNQASRRSPRAGRGGRSERPPQAAAMPRSMQHRGESESRKAVQPIGTRRRRALIRRRVTRVTHETEVRGTETRVERVVERASKPTLSGVDRAAGSAAATSTASSARARR